MSSAVVSARASTPTASCSGSGPRLRVLAAGPVATPGLPVGTRVQLREGAGLKGTVMSYQRECLPGLLGLFPVRLDNAIWQTCHANDVIVLAPSTPIPEAEVRTESGK